MQPSFKQSFMFVIALLAMSLGIIPAYAAAPIVFTITKAADTTDTLGYMGEYSSLALNSSGHPVILYSFLYSRGGGGGMVLAVCADAACTSTTRAYVEEDYSNGGYGYQTSMVLNSSGFPVTSYHQEESAADDVKVAVCGDANCTTKTIVTVDSTSNSPSLTLNGSGYPVISYFNYGSSELKVAVCGDATCTAPTLTVVDTGSYSSTSIALNSSGYPVISYYDGTNSTLKVAVCGDATCTSKTLTTVDNNLGSTSQYPTSLKLNSSGYPVISYYDGTNFDLKLAVCADATCASKTLTTVDGAESVGKSASLELNSSGYPVISYYDETNLDLKVALCADATCAASTIMAVDGAGGFGIYSSLKLDSSGNPVIVYHDEDNNYKKMARVSNVQVAPVKPVLTAPVNKSLVATNTPTLDWNPVLASATATAAVSYDVEYANNVVFVSSTTVNVAAPNTEYTFTAPLVEGSPYYYWRVRAYNSTGQYSAWSATRQFKTRLDTPVLTAPVDSAAPALSTKRPTFTWNAVSEATSYTLQILKGTKTVVNATIKAPATTYTPAADLLADTTYTWRVLATGLVPSSYSAPFTFTTRLNAPAKPILLSPATGASVDGLAVQTLTWEPVLATANTPAAVSYDLEYATNFIFASSTIVNITAPTTQYTLAAPLLANTTYYWRVRSYNVTNQFSEWSVNREFQSETNITATTPNLWAPYTTKIVSVTPSLDWYSSKSIDNSYLVKPWHYEINVISLDGAYNHTFTGDLHNQFPASSADWSTAPLSPNTIYAWKVRAFNGTDQYSKWSLPRVFRTMLAEPVLRLPADQTLETNKRPTFTWDAVPGATSYTLKIGKSTFKIKAPAHTYTPTFRFPPSKIYTWSVQANGYNQGVFSAPFYFISGIHPPKPPLVAAYRSRYDLQAFEYLQTGWDANLIWPASVSSGVITKPLTYYPEAVSYDVEVSTNLLFKNIDASNNVKLLNVTSTSIHLSQVLAVGTAPDNVIRPGRPYYWRVRSVSASGNYSEWSNIAKFHTELATPIVVSAIDSNPSGWPKFTWSANGNGFWQKSTVKIESIPAGDVTGTIPILNGDLFARLPLLDKYSLPAGAYRWRVEMTFLPFSKYSEWSPTFYISNP